MGTKKRGRPSVGERVPLGLRVTPEMKSRLDAAAMQSGRSQSQEAEFRLERSFDRTDLLSEVLSLEYGNELAGFLMLLGTAMIFADSSRQVERPKPIAAKHWTWGADAEAYNEALQAAVTLLEAFRPQAATPPVSSGAGVEMAKAIIKVVRGDSDAVINGFTSDVPKVRPLLGQMLEHLHAEKPSAHPFHLAMDVLQTAGALEQFSKNHTARGGGIPLPKDEVVELLERHLGEYLVTDWQQRGARDEGQHSTTGAEILAFEVRRRA